MVSSRRVPEDDDRGKLKQLHGAERWTCADAKYAVAMTRPKRHLCVIGDSETVGR